MESRNSAWAVSFGLSLALLLLAPALAAEETQRFQCTVSSDNGSVPERYAPPMVGNGSLCLLVDGQGCQVQRAYVGMTPGIYWAGRRYGPPNDQLIPFGHFEQELSLDGQPCAAPTRWTQALNTREALVTCRDDYAGGLSALTQVFAPLGDDLVVIKKRFTGAGAHSVRLVFKYQFTPPGKENRAPRRTVVTPAWDEAARSATLRYEADGHRTYQGVIAVFSDAAVTSAQDKQVVTLTATLPLDAGRGAEATFYLLFADSMDGPDHAERAARLRERVRREGFDSLLAAHRRKWAAYSDESFAHVPDERMERAYLTAQYHLRACATRWSIPVGIFPTHWAGRYFGWDEMFCFLGLASSNHLAVSRRVPEFRFAGLGKAVQRASHYNKPGAYGAHYPWETLEDGTEGTPPGFWLEHVFHMSNIAVSAWQQYLYTADLNYLRNTGYPVIKECATFFDANMIYPSPDGGMFLGKCTDLERLGPAKVNPFMSCCGAIATLEAASRAAGLLETDGPLAESWRATAEKLRRSLPNDGHQYVPYTGCTEQSIAVLGGLFPYGVFDAGNRLQRNAVYAFMREGQASGNMYPLGTSLCAWYAAWQAAALADLGDTQQPASLLSRAAEGAGCFGELFEINEPKVAMRPWFATAAGDYVYALNRMLLQCAQDRIAIAPAAPEEWKDYSFKLAAYGNLTITVAVKDGRLAQLLLEPGDRSLEGSRTLAIPERLLEGVVLDPAAVASATTRPGYRCVSVRFKGALNMVSGAR